MLVVSESLNKCTTDGKTIPWEVTKTLKVLQWVGNQSKFTRAVIYIVIFVLVMNKV